MQYERCAVGSAGLSLADVLNRLFTSPFAVVPATLAFFFVNAVDVMLTLILLSQGGFREANPLANFVLQQWGEGGMVFYKIVFVAAIALIAQIIATKREGVARGVLFAGTAVVSTVVAYSSHLLFTYWHLI